MRKQKFDEQLNVLKKLHGCGFKMFAQFWGYYKT